MLPIPFWYSDSALVEEVQNPAIWLYMGHSSEIFLRKKDHSHWTAAVGRL